MFAGSKIARGTLLAVVAVFGLVFLAGAQEGAIKLGAVLPLGDITGAQAAKAMELAVDEINAAGGVLGLSLIHI